MCRNKVVIHAAYLWSHGDLDSIGQLLDAPEHEGPGVDAEPDVLGGVAPAPGEPAPDLHTQTRHGVRGK